MVIMYGKLMLRAHNGPLAQPMSMPLTKEGGLLYADTQERRCRSRFAWPHRWHA